MGKNSKDIVFTSALRTAIGKFKGIWSELQAHDLGKVVITNILHQSEIEPKFIDEVRKIRPDIEHECQYDSKAYFAHLLEIQMQYGDWPVCRQPTSALVVQEN